MAGVLDLYGAVDFAAGIIEDSDSDAVDSIGVAEPEAGLISYRLCGAYRGGITAGFEYIILRA